MILGPKPNRHCFTTEARYAHSVTYRRWRAMPSASHIEAKGCLVCWLKMLKGRDKASIFDAVVMRFWILLNPTHWSFNTHTLTQLTLFAQSPEEWSKLLDPRTPRKFNILINTGLAHRRWHTVQTSTWTDNIYKTSDMVRPTLWFPCRRSQLPVGARASAHPRNRCPCCDTLSKNDPLWVVA